MAGSISSAGIGSGLDVSGIISKLMVSEQAPLTKLQRDASAMQTQLSAFGQMQSLVSGFRDATAALYATDAYSLTTAGSTDASTVGASSTPKAAPGSYAVSVTALAAAQNLVSASGQFAASTDAVGTGSLTIRLGTWNADRTAFTAKTGSSDIVVPVGASESTLAGIRDKINAANAGVSASIVTDATGARLALRSVATGAENGFRVTVTDDDGNGTDAAGLSRLAFDPPGGAGLMTLAQAAANTQATINGIAVSAPGATLTDVVEGLTFTLNKVTTSPVTVTVARNTDAVKKALSAFVTAFNALNTFLDQTTRYDASTKTAAPLQGDAAAVGVQNQIRAALGQAGSGSATFATLSSIGVEFQKDGSLKLNDAKLATALGNLSELQNALALDDKASPSRNGFARKLAALADKLLASGGTLPGKTKSIETRIAANQKDQAKAVERLADIEKRLRAQYAALDSTMARANALSQYVSQQVTAWNNVKVNA